MAGIQLSGLISGFDTQSLISLLMEKEIKPLELMEEKRDRLVSVQDAWNDVNTRLNNLRNSLTQLKLSTTFNNKVVASSDDNVLTATADTSATASRHQVKVNQLADYKRYASLSASALTDDTNATSSTALGLAGSFQITAAGGTAEESLIVITTADTLKSISDKINQADAGVEATIVDGRLLIKSNTMGTAGDFAITTGDQPDANNETILNKLGLTAPITEAQDAEIVYQGLTITRSSNSVDNLISGVTLNLVSESATSITLTINNDTSKAVDAISSFVDQYNYLMMFINEYTAVDPYDSSSVRLSSDSSPYDANRQRGPLQGDATIINLEAQIRTITNQTVAGLNPLLNSLSDLGITTERFTGAGSGKLVGYLEINEAKLQSALATPPASATITGRESLPVQYHSFVSKSAADISGDNTATAATALGLDGIFTVQAANSTLDPATINITAAPSDSLTDIMNKINLTRAGVTASIEDNKLVLSSNSMGLPGEIILTDSVTNPALDSLGFSLRSQVSESNYVLQAGQSGRLTIAIDGSDYQVSLSGPQTTQQALEEINSVIGSVATASLDSRNNIVITGRSSGVSSFIQIKQIMEDHPGDLARLGLTEGLNGRGQEVGAIFSAQVSATQGAITSLTPLGNNPVTGRGILGLEIDGASYTVEFTGATNRDDLVNHINKAIGEVAQAYLDSNNHLIIRSLKTGSESTIRISRIDPALSGLNLAVGQTGSGVNEINGLAVVLDNFYYSWIKSGGILSQKTSLLQGQVDDINRQMLALVERVEKREEQLWKQYSNMELKLSQLQYQSTYLESQLSLLNSYTSNS